ncbi:hypothetical protein JTE90_024142 [Oedothorax gibbosus]|uniref:Palmitoyltransferase n=1 Tax=Oedothorax gibbosus TaxID=931172 RepID=A0AAV6U625_9ARAC|nr:hypothetical protein JTE90_024142 [Oedothorax gibbosus]
MAANCGFLRRVTGKQDGVYFHPPDCYIQPAMMEYLVRPSKTTVAVKWRTNAAIRIWFRASGCQGFPFRSGNVITQDLHSLVMVQIRCLRFEWCKRFMRWLWLVYSLTKLTLKSLFYNDFADANYIGDTCMEPMFWFVDHFTKVLGPICVIAVIVLFLSMIIIAYVIGLPFYLKQNFYVLSTALLIGHWLLVNVVFYYYMAFTTGPGSPPQGAMITEAVSICKRCIAPKPPRTHHCSVCNRCILKMDHHCPWLNNCVGHFNHRYFFMFGVYTWVGVVFICLFGIPVAYDHFFVAEHNSITPIVVSFIRNIPKYVSVHRYFLQKKEKLVLPSDVVPSNSTVVSKWPETAYHSCIVYAALLCISVLVVLGALLAWHARLISRGETSIEGHINKKETARLAKEGQVYKNPYDFGLRNNWKLFLCIGYNRPWWHLLFPFVEEPLCDGIRWSFLSDKELDLNELKKQHSKTCYVKIS